MSWKDSCGRPVAVGRYLLTKSGDVPVVVQVEEHTDCELWVVSDCAGTTGRQHIDSLDTDVVFHRSRSPQTDVDVLAGLGLNAEVMA